MNTKICSKCKKEKSITEFTDISQYYCKKCRKEYKRANKEKCHKQHLKDRYGITSEQYIKQIDIIYCPICGNKFDSIKHIKCIDHNHITGEIRGVICKLCNHALGLTKENIHTLFAMISYLKGDLKNI